MIWQMHAKLAMMSMLLPLSGGAGCLCVPINGRELGCQSHLVSSFLA